MLKLIILASVLLSSSAFATPVEQMMTIKERLRISLWVEGIHEQKFAKNHPEHQRVILPEEIERALKKL